MQWCQDSATGRRTRTLTVTNVRHVCVGYRGAVIFTFLVQVFVLLSYWSTQTLTANVGNTKQPSRWRYINTTSIQLYYRYIRFFQVLLSKLLTVIMNKIQLGNFSCS